MRARIYLAFVVLAGCGPSVPTFPIYGRDAGLECGDDLGECPSGQVCLQQRCYASCSETRPCGPREECSSGMCVAAIDRDAGMPDAAPPDPCDSVTCDAPLAECRAGTCVACAANGAVPAQCGGGAPICDLGRGTCVAFAPEVCAPCASDLDCAGTSVPTTCEILAATDEQVCAPSCTAAGDGCPTGFTCDTSTMVCAPTLASCTDLRSAVTRRECGDGAGGTNDAACTAIGVIPTSGACFDDSGVGSPATCHFPCSATLPCPGALTCAGAFCM